MELDVWFAFVTATFLLLIIPGPTTMLVLSYALTQGKRVAIATASGVALGDLIAMTTSVAGLGALVLASAELFTILKWIGAVYLVFLGIKLFLSAKDASDTELVNHQDMPAKGVFTHAAIVTALNPKSIAFFIAFVPQFVDSSAPLIPQFATLIATFVSLAAIYALSYALVADRLRVRMTKASTIAWLSRIGGSALIAMGVFTATMRRASVQ